MGYVFLPLRSINTKLAEHAFHTKGASLIRNNWHNTLANSLILYECTQNTYKRHSGGDFTAIRPIQYRFENTQLGYFQRLTVFATFRIKPAKLLPSFPHVHHFRAIWCRTVIRYIVQFFILQGDTKPVPEGFK